MVRIKSQAMSSWFLNQVKSFLPSAKRLTGKNAFSFLIRWRIFLRKENVDESSIAAYKLQCGPPSRSQGPPSSSQGPPARTEGIFLHRFDLASPMLDGFDEWTLFGKLRILIMPGSQFCSRVTKEKKRTKAPFFRRVLTLLGKVPRIHKCIRKTNFSERGIADCFSFTFRAMSNRRSMQPIF